VQDKVQGTLQQDWPKIFISKVHQGLGGDLSNKPCRTSFFSVESLLCLLSHSQFT
jgi:hypothetical protein